MKILICYATTEGQTRKISQYCANQLFALGHSVELLNVSDADDLDIDSFDAAILAGSVHIGHVQKALGHFAAQFHAALNAMPTLFLQVSLAAAGTDPQEHAELEKIAGEFCAEAEWIPGQVVQVPGAFRFTQYDFFRSWAMRYIASQKGETVDPKADKEYTNWAALGDLMRAWAPVA
ncbi:flavodoxin domain-containing protein [Arenibacterium sp. CAU 1754]